jgi:hypothetical protein
VSNCQHDEPLPAQAASLLRNQNKKRNGFKLKQDQASTTIPKKDRK